MSTTTHTIDDLRAHLFDTIKGVRAGTVTIEKAQTISHLAQVVVNSAKVEVDYIRATERDDSRFLSTTAVEAPTGTATPGNAIVGIRQHLLKDR